MLLTFRIDRLSSGVETWVQTTLVNNSNWLQRERRRIWGLKTGDPWTV